MRAGAADDGGRPRERLRVRSGCFCVSNLLQSPFCDRRPSAPQLRISTPSLLRTRTRSAPATLVCKKMLFAFALAPSGSRSAWLILLKTSGSARPGEISDQLNEVHHRSSVRLQPPPYFATSAGRWPSLACIPYLPSRASLSLLRRLLATVALLAPAAGSSASIDRGACLLAKDSSPSIGFPAEPLRQHCRRMGSPRRN